MLHSPTPTEDERVRSLLDERTRRAALPCSADFAHSPASSFYSPRTVRSRWNPDLTQNSFLPYSAYSPSQPGPLTDPDVHPVSPGPSPPDDDCIYGNSCAPHTSHERRVIADVDFRSNVRSDDYMKDLDDESHMSFLGPKMRIHSPAPWEMDGSTTSDGEEREPSDSSSVNDVRSIFGGKKRPRARTTDSSFTRKDSLPRPSIESMWPQSKPKKSSDAVTSNRSTLYVYPSQPHERTEMHVSLPESDQSSMFSATTKEEFVHPYANPDAVTWHRDSRLLGELPAEDTNQSDSRATITLTGTGISERLGASLSSASHSQQRQESSSSGAESFQLPLISLEEARERARGLSTSIKGRPRSSSFGSRPANRLNTIHVDAESLGRSSVLTAQKPIDPSTALLSPVIVMSGKTVKHKKSGLMNKLNLFSSKDARQGTLHFGIVPPVPPIPALNSTILTTNSADRDMELRDTSNAIIEQQWNPSTTGQNANNRLLKRVPVPTLASNDPTVSGQADRTNIGSMARVRAGRTQPVLKKPPPLNVVVTTSHPESQGPASALPLMLGEGREQGTSLSTPRREDGPRSAPPSTTAFPSLRLRPMSTVFSAHFANHILDEAPHSNSALRESHQSLNGSSIMSGDVETPTSSTSNDSLLSPASVPSFNAAAISLSSVKEEDFSGHPTNSAAVIQALQNQISSTRKGWQRQIWELECQLRELQLEVEELREAKKSPELCEICRRNVDGRGVEFGPEYAAPSVLNRPRAKTSTGSRFGSGR